MRKQKLFPLILLLLSFLSLSGFKSNLQSETAIARITQVDTSEFPKVTVYITITDENGLPVGIDPARITLMENGIPIPGNQIEGTGEVESLTTLLVMDISASMLRVEKLKGAKAAAIEFVNQLRVNDKVGLVSFNSQIEYVQPITTDRELIVGAINGLTAGDDTAMYDALSQAIKILEAVEGRKAIVALTDGLDNISAATPEIVLQQIDSSGLSISTIGLGDPNLGLDSVTALDQEALTYLAENAGGVFGYANDIESLTSLYKSYAAVYKSEYQLTYTSPAALRDGVNRSLSVSLSGSTKPIAEIEKGATTYNPGGLVPEVSEPAPWSLFGIAISALVLLLFLPSLIRATSRLVGNRSSTAGSRRKNKTRIKLLD